MCFFLFLFFGLYVCLLRVYIFGRRVSGGWFSMLLYVLSMADGMCGFSNR